MVTNNKWLFMRKKAKKKAKKAKFKEKSEKINIKKFLYINI